MNKKLVALAVAGVLAAPLAQAQTANVTLYGRVNLDVEFVKGSIYDNNAVQPATCNKTLNFNCNTTNPTVYRMGTNSSRFGLRGTESLGGGLNAIFQVESSIDPAHSGGTLAGRESYVGLQGGWGTFKMGRFLTPYDDIHPIFGNVPTLTTSILSTASLWAQGFVPTSSGGFDDRVAPVDSLRLPEPVGLHVRGPVRPAGHQLREPGRADHDADRQQRLHFQRRRVLQQRPDPAGCRLYRQRGVRGTQAILASPTAPPVGSSTTGSKLNDYAFSVAGAYNFTIVKVGAVYELLKYDNEGLEGGDLKRNFWGASLTGNLGPGQAYLFYGQANNGTGSAPDGTRVGGLVKGEDTRAIQWEISYTYPLSKRTLLYIGLREDRQQGQRRSTTSTSTRTTR